MQTTKYKSSPWILNIGLFYFLQYDPLCQHLFGLCDQGTFTLYNLTTLIVVKEYTRHETDKYAFSHAVQTRYQNSTMNAFDIKMNLNLVGIKKDIVTKVFVSPNIFTMTYDIESKTALVTWQQKNNPPLYGSIYTYNSQSTVFQFYANFSFHIDDNATYLYFFENGPVAVTNNSLSTIYFPIQCGTSFQKLFLISYNIRTKKYKQSPWILSNGVFHFLHYDPLRQRLFGLRDESTFTLILEEYNLTTLNIVKEYTRQDGGKYAFAYAWCSIFDYNENWIVQVRTRFENPSVNAYYIKMDLNLVGKKEDIVTEFRLLPNIHNLCTMTYDIETKTALVTWQHGSIDQNIVMMYMNPITSEFTNETLLLETGSGYVIDSIKAVYNEKTHEVLFIIHKETETDADGENWMIIVDFYTMKIINKKQVDTITAFEYWEFFLS